MKKICKFNYSPFRRTDFALFISGDTADYANEVKVSRELSQSHYQLEISSNYNQQK